ncbi:MAG: cytochrome bc complex cytochrome b subunit, partial [Leptospiraceae bacterium]|nr:cytochrome bc complex cytochrome b subunit [Leptospiraceae bacterium]
MKALKNWFQERIPLDPESLKELGSEPVPGHLKHWWWCLGGTPAYLFLVQVATGIMLSFYYNPGQETSYESVKHITEVVPYGWYIRSIHRWASNFMVIAVILHMMRVFFTGGYRKPREINWMIGVSLLIVTLIFGFSGYSLIYEQLSYWGLTVAGNITESVPAIGPMIADFMRAGSKIGKETLSRMFVIHIGVLPTVMFILLGVHIMFIRLLGVTEFKFEKEENKPKTFPFFPDHLLSEIALGVSLMFFITILSVIFPIGLEEKANPLVTPPHIKPEWYFYFTFRWLKLTSLTFAVLSLGAGAFMLMMWPLIDNFFRRKNKNRELSIFLGIVGVV